MPLKVWHHWSSVDLASNPGFPFRILSRSFGEKSGVLQSCETKSGMESLGSRLQLTGRNRFTRSFSGSYKMTNGSRVCKLFLGIEGEAIKESVARESTETRSRWAPSRMANQWRCWANSTRTSVMSDVFIVLFTSLAHFWFVILVRTAFACLLYL